MSPPPHIENVASVNFRLQPKTWDFVTARSADIESNWSRRCGENPKLFNGNVLLMYNVAFNAISNGARLEGACFIAEYKSFQAWHDFGRPGDVKNLFAMAALRTADGAFLLGEMAPWTMNAGQLYFPAGTPDLGDLDGDRLDLGGSALRELAEETGLAPPDATPVPGWTIVFNGPLIACMKEMRTTLTAQELIARTARFFAQDKNPELTRLVPVFGPDDLTTQMPAFMHAYLQRAFAAGDDQV